MKAICWNGKYDVRTEVVPDPKIINPRDAILRVTTTAICGSDLHLYDGMIPTMIEGDILGHEFMGEVVELGSEVKNLTVGDRVLVPFNIACGSCFFCKSDLWSLCDNSNPNAALASKVYGEAPAGLFGYSHMMGGYDGGQAEYVRVPFADVGPIKIPEGIADDKVLFLTDIFPTGYMAAENAQIEPGDVVAIWGCGPVGQFAIRSAIMLGAERILAIDREPNRLKMAQDADPRVEAIDFEAASPNVVEELIERTAGRGPDRCIDCVGQEAMGHGFGIMMDTAKQMAKLKSDRNEVLRQAITACRKGGIISICGVYGGMDDSLNFGTAFNKGLTFRMGQTHVHRYLEPLLKRIQNGDIDPSFVITHRGSLDDGPQLYRRFKQEKNSVIKCVMYPHGQSYVA